MRIRKRMGLPASYLHVMNRGARRIRIFKDDEDREIFVGLLKRFAKKYQVDVIAWCLMPNHYHLELYGEGTPIVLMMRDLDGVYARIFNQRHAGSGHLFQGPFRSTLLLDLEGVAYVSRYIHQNPLDLGCRPADYPWSSCRSYLGLAPIPSWLKPGAVLASMDDRIENRFQAYRAYLEQAPVRRKRRAAKHWEVAEKEFSLDYLGHLEQRIMARLGDSPEVLGEGAARTAVVWSALRQHGIPAGDVAQFYGYKDPDVVHTIASRFQKRVEGIPALGVLLGGVWKRATQVS